MKRFKKQIWFICRFGMYILLNVLWPTVFLPICVISKWLGRPLFSFIFVVYPGTIDQVRGYAPLWYRNITPDLAPIGMIKSADKEKRGLVMTICWTLEELETQNEFLRKIADKTKKIAKIIGADSVALAGRMPSVLHKNKYRVSPPLVAGDKGAVYTILLSVAAALKADKLNSKTARIGIIGYGFLGSRLADALEEIGFNDIICVDPRIIKEEKNENILLTRDPAALNNCDLAVVLTAKGEQIDAIIDHFKKGVIVIDDTHPQLPVHLENLIKSRKKGKIIKAALGLDGVYFSPRLPKWQADWIPGCCVEALVSAIFGFTSSQRRFNELANMLNFKALNIANKSDL